MSVSNKILSSSYLCRYMLLRANSWPQDYINNIAIIAQQLTGIAMGMAPAPAIANIYVALFEQDVILPRFKMCLPLYLRFIDDGLAIWKHICNSIMDKQLLDKCKDTINAGGLKWTFST